MGCPPFHCRESVPKPLEKPTETAGGSERACLREPISAGNPGRCGAHKENPGAEARGGSPSPLMKTSGRIIARRLELRKGRARVRSGATGVVGAASLLGGSTGQTKGRRRARGASVAAWKAGASLH
jgi:hypothetical protein